MPLQCQEERWYSDTYYVNESHLERSPRICGSEEYKNDAQDTRIDRFGQIKRADALDVADDRAAFSDDILHGCKFRIEQDNVRCMLSRFRSVCHSDAAIRVLDRKDIVDAVSDHGNRMSALLPGLDESLFLFGLDAPEDRTVTDRLSKERRVLRKRGCIHILFCSFHSGLLRHGGYRSRVVPGEDFYPDPRIGKESEGLLSILANDIRNHDNCQRIQFTKIPPFFGNAPG